MDKTTLTTARRQLGEAAFAEAWGRGQGMEIGEAIAVALDALD